MPGRVLAAAAAITSRVDAGPARHARRLLQPGRAGQEGGHGGRDLRRAADPGAGAGWNEVEFRGYGVPFDHRISRFEEAFTIIRTLLQEGAIDFEGDYYSARDCELVPRSRPGGPPIMIGSVGERMLEITLPYVAVLERLAHRHAATARPAWRRCCARVAAACREVGRDPATVEATVVVLVRMPGGTGRRQGDGTGPDAQPARRARRRRSPRSCAPTLEPAWPRSSWSSTRSRSSRWRAWRRCWSCSIAAETRGAVGSRPRTAPSPGPAWDHPVHYAAPRRSSSVVEQGTHKPLVTGSNPVSATNDRHPRPGPAPGPSSFPGRRPRRAPATRTSGRRRSRRPNIPAPLGRVLSVRAGRAARDPRASGSRSEGRSARPTGPSGVYCGGRIGPVPTATSGGSATP